MPPIAPPPMTRTRIAQFLAWLACPLALAPAAHAQTLPRNTAPEQLVVARDGSAWMTEKKGFALIHVGADGTTRDYLETDRHLVNDIAATADGAVWVARDDEVVRFAADGRVTRLRASVDETPEAIAPAGVDAVWITYDRYPRPQIARVGADGTRRPITFPGPTHDEVLKPIAPALDGSLWFIENGDPKSWIARLSADGHYAHWPAPELPGDYAYFAAGPDGTMWFTGTDAIWRIDSGGRLTKVALGAGLIPHYAVSVDGALYFTTDICVGRVSTAGAVTTWPVPGALQLEGIAARADGTFWLADHAANALKSFSPSATPGPCGAASLTQAAGPTSATITFQRHSAQYFAQIQLRVDRGGQTLRTEAESDEALGEADSLTVRDLDGDGEPEVMLALSENDRLQWSRIFRYDPKRNAYTVLQRYWGDRGTEPVLRDLDHDGRPELVSNDGRYSDKYNEFTPSAMPVQIWTYRAGRLARHPPLPATDPQRRGGDLALLPQAPERRALDASRLGGRGVHAGPSRAGRPRAGARGGARRARGRRVRRAVRHEELHPSREEPDPEDRLQPQGGAAGELGRAVGGGQQHARRDLAAARQREAHLRAAPSLATAPATSRSAP